MIYGNAHNLKIIVTNGNAADRDLDTIVKSEKLLKIITTQDMNLLLTAKSKSTEADEDDYLLKANVEYGFSVGTGIDRIALYNDSGSDGVAHVMIMY